MAEMRFKAEQMCGYIKSLEEDQNRRMSPNLHQRTFQGIARGRA